MNLPSVSLTSPHHDATPRRAFVLCGALAAALCSCSTTPQNQEPDQAGSILKHSLQTLASAKSLTYSGKRTMSPALATILGDKESSTVKGTLVRPDKFKGAITDASGTRQLSYDGKNFDIYDTATKAHAHLSTAGSVDDLFKLLDETYGFNPPAADFLAADPYSALMEDHPVGKVVGNEVVAGRACQHLSFTEKSGAWDVWLDADSLPRKYQHVFTSLPSKPSLTVEITQWDLHPKTNASAFTFLTPKDAVETSLVPLNQKD